LFKFYLTKIAARKLIKKNPAKIIKTNLELDYVLSPNKLIPPKPNKNPKVCAAASKYPADEL